MKTLIFTVTNDLNYDQRMIRICSSLAHAGYPVKLVGRKVKDSIPLDVMPYQQKRLVCLFNSGFLFYAEYNIRLMVYLLFQRPALLCAIDLDTMLPVLFVSWIKKCKRVYDAHELFCEMKEIATRPPVYRVWKAIERFAVPRFVHGYTVNDVIAAEFRNMYGHSYEVIRNIPLLSPLTGTPKKKCYVLYQGAVNEGRSFETLIPAFRSIKVPLVICGDGNFMQQARRLASQYSVEHKVEFTGKLPPTRLRAYTQGATIGVTLFDKTGLSNYYSLANRFFDYMHAGIPQLCVDFPVYRNIVEKYRCALLIDDLSAENIAFHVNRLLTDQSLYNELQRQCLLAREELNWQNEEKKLVAFYQQILPKHG